MTNQWKLLSCLAFGAFFAVTSATPSAAAGELVIEFNAAYNLVVDSNVCSPSTYAPRIATIGAAVCNYGNAPVTEVVANIGDFGAKTPGFYPVRTNAEVASTSPCLAGRGDFALTHLGDLVDATRYIGTLDPGDCSWQYWSFTYPRRQNLVRDDDTCGDPVWCDTNNPNDDLFLPFDVWTTSREGLVANDTWRVTMRNEISASANKIFPNGAAWFNQPEICEPGLLVTTNGVNYELGVVNKGFDNDGDGQPDYNAWLQPIGDEAWNPACFRLVETSGQLQVSRPGSLGGGTDLIDFENNLYFTNLGKNNGVVGTVFYTFACLGGACNVPLTPYQEAASGFDNEKFAGDYGVQTVTMMTTTPNVTLEKEVADTAPATPDGIAANGETLEYTIDLENTGLSDLGNPSFGMPLVVRDSIPAGTSYAAASTGASFTGCACTVITLYSTNNGVSWSTVEPTPASAVTDLQWRLEQAFPSMATATFTFDVVVDSPYLEPEPVVLNTAKASFGDAPSFAEDTAGIVTGGPNSIGDTVWNDNGGTTGIALDGIQNGDESGLGPVVVTLYWDRNGDGLLDAGDLSVRQETSDGAGAYLFDQVPDGDWIVVVDKDDPASTGIPTGYANTTPEEVAVTGLGLFPDRTDDPAPEVVTSVDFGFGPSLLVDKTLTSANPALEGDLVTFAIDVTNTRPSSNLPCTYDVWGESLRVASSFGSPTNALGVGGPDGLYAESDGGGSGDDIELEGWSLGVNPGSINQVEVIFQIDLTQALVNDDLDVELFVAGLSEGTNTFSTATLNTYVNNAGELVWDVTSLRAWDWADFPAGSPAAYTSVFADFKHTGGPDVGILRIDAVGFRVTSDQACGGNAEDDMSLVPLADTYDPALLAFVSANPPQTSVAGGVIDWANVGPLRAGETTTITVTFRALEPASDTDSLTINTASVTGAQFVDGDPTNDDSGMDSVTIRPTGEIGDRIWNDNVVTANYVQDAGEVGIPGVTVRLCIDDDGTLGCGVGDSVFLTTTTDANGDYLFSGLADAGAPGADTYRIEVDTTTLPGSTFDLTGDPDVGACAIFPVPDPAGCDSFSTTTIAPGDGAPANNFDLTQDYAYTIPTTIFGNLWEDNNGNAVQGNGLGDLQGEDPFAGVTVELCIDDNGTPGCQPTDSVYLTTASDSNGDYLFSDLAAATYTVEAVTTTLPTGPVWNQTVDPDATLDSLHTVAVAAGAISGSHDFAYQATGAGVIGGAVYADWNGDGSQDPGVPTPEEGIAGVTVFLYEDEDGDGIVDPEDALIATAVTAADGSYAFTNLATSATGESYSVVVDQTDPDLPASWNQTEDPDEAGVCTICDADGAVTLTDATPAATDVDFGYQPRGFGIIGDTVFQDDDGSGIQDPGELGLRNITVTLYEDQDGDGVLAPEDAVIATTSTDVNGNYSFFDLPAGNYLVDVDTTDPQLPSDGGGNPYTLSTANDPDPVSLATDSSIVLDADFGFAPGGTIGDTVWRDDDGDGQLDTNEQGIQDIAVTLYLDDGDGVFEDPANPGACTPPTTGCDTLIATTSTDANGLYEFIGLEAADYHVVVDQADAQLPAGSSLTGDPDEVGGCVTCDGLTTVSLAPAQVVRFADFGFQPGGTIGDAVWIDDEDLLDATPGDGVYDPFTETGISGVTINLYLDDGDGIFEPGAGDGAPIATTATDADGYYSFGEIANGTYWVEVVTTDPDYPANATQTVDPDEAFPCATCDNAGLVTLTATDNNIDTIDFGYGLTPVPEVVIDKDTSTPNVFAGGTADYTIVVSNIGGAGAGLLSVADVLPAGFTLAGTTANTLAGGATGPATCASLAPATPCGTFTLPAGASVTLAFTVNVAGSVADGTYDNTASATYDSNGDLVTDTTVDDDGLAAQDPGTPNGQDPEADEDVTVGPLPEYTVTKASSIPVTGGGFVDPNEVFTYTVTITNTGTAVATDLTVNDPLPTGVSAVPGTTMVTFPQNDPPQTFADDFESGADTGTSGSLGWSGNPWTRSGDALFATDTGVSPNQNVLEVGASGATATRAADLSPYALGTLTIDYRRVGFDSASDFVVIEVTADVTAGSPVWAELERFDGAVIGTDTAYQASLSHDLLNYMTSTFALRFRSSGLANNNEQLYVDNLQLEVISRSTTTQPGGDPPNLVTPGDGLSLVPDGLQAGEVVTITFDVVADADLTGLADITNTVLVSSAEIPQPKTASVTDPVNLPGAWSLNGTVWDDDGTPPPPTGGNRDGVLGVNEPRLENVRVWLYDAAGTTLIRTTLTAADGTYSFDNLTAGSYVVRVDPSTLPAGYTQSGDPDEAGTCVTCDSESVASDPGGGGSVTKDFGYENEPTPTLVLITSVRDYLDSDTVIVEIETASQLGTIGFWLWRYDSEIEDYVQVNDEILPAAHAPQGAVYRIVDPGASLESNTYVVYEAEMGGSERAYGPFDVTVEPLGEPMLGREFAMSPRSPSGIEIKRLRMAEQERRQAVAVPRALSDQARKQEPGSRLVKVETQGEGIFFVSATQLANSFGVNSSTVRDAIGSGALELELMVDRAWKSVAWAPGHDQAGVFFYGEAVDSIYTEKNVYRASLDKGRQMGEVDARRPNPEPSHRGFWSTVELEEQVFAGTFASRDPEADFWYWAGMTAGHSQLGSIELPLPVADLVSDRRSLLRLRFYGANDAPGEPDHFVSVALNGVEIGAAEWDGLQGHEVELIVPRGALLDGANTVTLTAELGPETLASFVYLDRMELTYRRQYRAVGDRLELNGDNHRVVTVDGFTNPDIHVYEIGDPRRPRRVTGATIDQGDGYRVSFLPRNRQTLYRVLAAGAAPLAEVSPWVELAEIEDGAEYVVIAPRQLRRGAQRLAEYRAGQGMTTLVADLDEIHGSFGGLATPKAIASFLEQAAKKWRTPPLYVVLVGKGTFDYNDYQGLGGNLLPPLLTSTPFGLYASDGLFGDFQGGDGVSEVAIGRIPALLASELDSYIDKLIEYETSPAVPGEERLLLLADDADHGGDFKASSERVSQQLPDRFEQTKIYLDEQPAASARAELLAALDSGLRLVNYFGHGGVDRLAAESLLTNDDVDGLDNGDALPLLATMTCSVGRFELPGFSSLAESLILAENRGAIAVFSPSGTSINSEAEALNAIFLEALLATEGARLGTVVRESLEGFSSESSLPYLATVYNLIGDPALEIDR